MVKRNELIKFIYQTIGNNATIIKRLGAKITGQFWGEGWGFIAKFVEPQSLTALKNKCAKIFNHEISSFLVNSKPVRTIVVVSGSTKPNAEDIAVMEEQGVELFISGEPTESAPHKLLESGINYFIGGHYNTEVFGVQELGKRIKSRFGDKVKVEFIDIPNQV